MAYLLAGFLVLLAGQHRFCAPHRQPALCRNTGRTGREIPEDEVIMTCVALSYPDDSFAANAVRSDREHNDEFVRYVGFAE
ncbi:MULTISPECIES: hypothetical protein [unclassified Bradyrhizobium]|jgi:hypothetical protein|uniref:hypothetical protein n=1 Tax=unclassified Bradyrhizobium TaxID=2631580 RepID=UPI001FFB6E92|nr:MULTISPECIES: hypothetical protein [unclassified Bradyrhizobium]